MAFPQTTTGLFRSSALCCGCLKIHFCETKRKQNVVWRSSKFSSPPVSFFSQTPQGGYWWVEAWQFGTVSMMCYLLGGTVAHWSKGFTVCKGRLRAISCESRLSPEFISVLPSNLRMQLSLQCRHCVVFHCGGRKGTWNGRVSRKNSGWLTPIWGDEWPSKRRQEV